MKRIAFAIVFACCTLAMAAQETIRVNFQGANPTISDFAQAFLSSHDDDEEDDCIDESFNAIQYAWDQHRKGIPLNEGTTLTIDQKNGYVLYEYKQDEHLLRIEMCYWNEADRKHKLFAYNVACFDNGKHSPGQFDGLTFYRYDNASKKMSLYSDIGFDVEYSTDDGAWMSYALPRTGKDIVVTYWYDHSQKQKTLKWNGRRFSF